MQTYKSNFINTGIATALFCAVAGATYGFLYALKCPASPAAISLLALSNATGGLAMINLVWKIFERRNVTSALALLVFAAIFELFTVGFAASSTSGCGLQVRSPEDLTRMEDLTQSEKR